MKHGLRRIAGWFTVHIPSRSFRVYSLILILVMLLGHAPVLHGESAKLVLSAWGSADYWIGMFERFHEEYPDVQIELQLHSASGYYDAIFVQIAAGVAPDLMISNPQNVLTFIKSGAWLNLESLIERDNFDFSPYLPAAWAYTKYRGERYAWPAGIDPGFPSHLWVYNRSLIAEAGLANPTADWTFEDLLAMGPKLTRDRDSDGQFDVYATTRPNDTWYWNWVWSNGGRIVSDDYKTLLVTEEPAVEALQLLIDLRTNSFGFTIPNNSQLPAFVAEKTSLFNTSLANARQLSTRGVTFDWDIVPYPRGRAGSVARAGDLPLGINAHSRHVEEAWNFLKWMLRKDVQRGAVEEGILTAPAHREVLLYDYVPRTPFDVMSLITQEYRFLPVFDGWIDLDYAIQEALSRAEDEHVSVKIALTAVEGVLRQVLGANQLLE